MSPVLLLAASGLAREALSTLRRLGRPVAGLLDDEPGLAGTTVGGVGVLGPLAAALDHPDCDLLVCVGSGRGRRAIVDRLDGLGIGPERFTSVIDPSVSVPDSCTVGPGSIVLAGTVLTADVTVGRHVVIMPRAVLTHDDEVADFATLCAGVTLGGSVTVGEAAYLGMAASVRPGVAIGSESTLGMGAVLLDPLPAGQTWVGVPARPLSTRGASPRLTHSLEGATR